MSGQIEQMENLNRRDVASRNVSVFRKLAHQIAAKGISPNQISVMSTLFAFLGGVALFKLPLIADMGSLFIASLVAFLGIQGRLVCNLLDGLVAIEGGKKTPVGDLYNEVPDRVSDTILIFALGVGLGSAGFSLAPLLGMAASLAALSTAYIRVLGGSLFLPQSFRGPMAKQHRMAFLNLGILLNLFEYGFRQRSGISLFVVLVVILLGSALTCYLRLREIAQVLEKKNLEKKH
ncbi:MAG: CDP-alcohol phosphatidyltransferase family protein [Pseudobdellovibrionaceae bacterium]